MTKISTNAQDHYESHTSNADRLLPLSRRVWLRRAAWCALGWPLLARVSLGPNLGEDPAVRPSLIMSPQREADGLKAQFDFVIRVS